MPSSRLLPGGIAVVTGVDKNMFYQLFLLLASIKKSGSEIHLYVCDFGLSLEQKEYLEQKQMLLKMPENLGITRHPYDYKSALGLYVESLNANCIVWLDCDLLIFAKLDSILPRLYRECKEVGAILAVANSQLSVAQFQSLGGSSYYASITPKSFLELPYLNSGFFICLSMEWLMRWHGLTKTMPLELLYEQNAFNVAAHDEWQSVKVLNHYIWNLTGDYISELNIQQSSQGLIQIDGQQGSPYILHITSNNRAKHLLQASIHSSYLDQEFVTQVRFFKEPKCLFEFQLAIYQASLNQELELLSKLNCLNGKEI